MHMSCGDDFSILDGEDFVRKQLKILQLLDGYA